ncbi:DUF6807 family protein [Curtobacterium ammoniigenes]|uniref:DUF6807 family protein n=1 Tax=Curtobacterium ammoniigenes TaxID=395387 RepID=UPI00082D4318|nr:DUF6807 family protein [Curtobacterium ammoniigenes]
MTNTDGLPRVVITGILGFGRHHLENARRLESDDLLRIVALVDPAALGSADAFAPTPVFADLGDALAAHPADIVIVATPIGTHASLCETAMRAGADVLLEKPPVPRWDDFEHLLEVARTTGRSIQVGFQSLGSHALSAFAADAFDLGPLVSVGAVGLWSRRRSYWGRARWAGRRVLDGELVVDGVTTNPLAHAVATALSIAGYDAASRVDAIETDLYRANPIDADDTAVVRITGEARVPVTCALTLCAPPEADGDGPRVIVTGTRGHAVLSYTTDVVTFRDQRRTFDRDDLLTDLIRHRRDGHPLIAPLAGVGAFMRVVEAVRLAPEPQHVDPAFVRWQSAGEPTDDAFPVIDGIVELAERAAASGATFAELGAPWAVAGHDRRLATLRVDGEDIAEVLDGSGTMPFSSPHPYLHPIRTLGGVTLSARHPADHDWHTGLSLTVQDADGVNFWGGRTYVRDDGYVRLDDHGRTVCDRADGTDDDVRLDLRWVGPRGDAILAEQRRIAVRAAGNDGWVLDLEARLTPATDQPVTIGSPGTKGRVDAGYGGLFWRLPACRSVEIFTSERRGEQAVNGSAAPWVAWSAEFLAGPGENGTATIVLVADGAETDRWFVRCSDYPGIGAALAWTEPLRVDAAGLVRRYRAFVADGRLTAEAIERIAARVVEEPA